MTTLQQLFLGAKNIIVVKDKKSPYYMAQWTNGRGKRCRRSTKVPVAGGIWGEERLSRAQAQRRALIVAQELARIEEKEYETFDNSSVREVCQKMLAGKLGHVSAATYENARADYKQFLSWLGNRADAPIRLLTRSDIKNWVTDRRSEVRAKTVQKALTAIRAAFEWALDAEIISKNPCSGVKVQPDSKDEKVLHEAFTMDEIRLLVDKLPDEWSAAVRCCIGTFGQRLGDVLSLKWEQFDWDSRVVRIVTGKTGRMLLQPMLDSFYAWARARYEQACATGGEAAVWVMPGLRKHSNPSPEFTQLVRLHGIGLVGKAAGGKRRVWHSKTFHSLRATVATMLQASGVSQGLAMELVGHESADVHAVYIRPTAAQLRFAAARLPEL